MQHSEKCCQPVPYAPLAGAWHTALNPLPATCWLLHLGQLLQAQLQHDLLLCSPGPHSWVGSPASGCWPGYHSERLMMLHWLLSSAAHPQVCKSIPDRGCIVHCMSGAELYHAGVCASVMSNSFATLWTVPARLRCLAILQARILEWVAMPSSRGSSQPGD